MNILILGDGLLGSEIIKQTDWVYISRKENCIDIRDIFSYRHFLWDTDIVVNCTGYTKTYDPNREPSWSINYVAVMDLVDLCNRYGKKLVHISTDYLYSGSVSDATEEDVPVHCPNWYTYSKLLADAYIQARSLDYLLVRCSFKPRPFPWDKAWDDLVGNFDYVDTIVGLIIKLINVNASGVYNVGTELKTMWELAIETKPDCNGGTHEYPPHNVSMNLSKLKDIT